MKHIITILFTAISLSGLYAQETNQVDVLYTLSTFDKAGAVNFLVQEMNMSQTDTSDDCSVFSTDNGDYLVCDNYVMFAFSGKGMYEKFLSNLKSIYGEPTKVENSGGKELLFGGYYTIYKDKSGEFMSINFGNEYLEE